MWLSIINISIPNLALKFKNFRTLRKMFFCLVTSVGQRKKILSPHEESNLRPSDNVYVDRLMYIPQLCDKCPTKIRLYPPLCFMRPWVVFLTVRRSVAPSIMIHCRWHADSTGSPSQSSSTLTVSPSKSILASKNASSSEGWKKNPVLNKLEYFKVSRHFAVLVHHYGLCDVVWDVP